MSFYYIPESIVVAGNPGDLTGVAALEEVSTPPGNMEAEVLCGQKCGRENLLIFGGL